jgi:hypothetical protein
MMGTTAPSRTDGVPQLIDELTVIRAEMAQAAAAHRTTLSGLRPDWRPSGRQQRYADAARKPNGHACDQSAMFGTLACDRRSASAFTGPSISRRISRTPGDRKDQ